MSEKIPEQFNLFDMPPDWAADWEGMPEFLSEDLTSHRKIIVHFRNDNDVEEFAKLIGQKVTPKAPSLWYPEMPHRKTSHLHYVDEQ